MLVLLAALALPAPQTTWYVDASAASPGSGTQSAPYTRIDFALAQASTQAGDTVLVAPGDYVGEAVDFLGKDVVLRSSGGSSVTTIRGIDPPVVDAPAVRLASGESSAAVVEGFTIVGSQGESTSAMGSAPIRSHGAGLFCRDASATLRDVRFLPGPIGTHAGGGAFVENGSISFTDCAFDGLGNDTLLRYGGGIAAYDADVLVVRCTFTGTRAGFQGGAISATGGNLQLDDCTFESTHSEDAEGGAVALSGVDAVIDQCTFDGSTSGGPGGAVYASSGTLEVRGSAFTANAADDGAARGGAIHAVAHGTWIRNCAFQDNVGSFGGAVYLSGSSTRVLDSTFHGNRADGANQVLCGGGGLHGGRYIIGCQFVGNSSISTWSLGGGGVRAAGTIESCTFVDNSTEPGLLSAVGSGNIVQHCIVRGSQTPLLDPGLTVVYSNVEGGFAGEGNFDADPRFWGAPDDLALLPDSPCIDSGTPGALADPDGTPPDLGALPFDPFHCGAGCAGSVGSTACSANMNSTGAAATLEAFGSAVVGDDRFVLTAAGVPHEQFGFFLASKTLGFQPLGGSSQGILCLGGSVLRIDQTVLTDRGTGAVSLRPDLGDLADGNPVVAGDTWHFQLWFRESSPFSSSNTSAALSVTFQ